MKIYWTHDTSVTVTEFTVQRSTDGGLTYTLVSTIAFSYSGANYDKTRRAFFYDDAGATPGYVYRIVATGPTGSSPPAIVVVPPNKPDTCTIIGYLYSPTGEPMKGTVVRVQTFGQKSGTWFPNHDGVFSRANNAVGLSLFDLEATVDENGMWSIALVQGIEARITIPDQRIDLAFRVPEEDGPINVRDIVPLQGAQHYEQWGEPRGVPNAPR